MVKVKGKVALLVFLLPSIILMTLFVFYPIIKTIIISFIDPKGGINISNYIYTYSLSGFSTAMYNTTIYTIFVTIIEMLLALIVAYSLSQKIKFKNTFQTIFFLPYVTSVIAIGTVFQVMYNSEYGIIDQILGIPIQWLGSEHALTSMIILGIWKGLAFNILIIFTAFSTIDPNLEKAAILDGFSSVGTFIKIKLPQIKGVLIYLLTMNIIFNIKVYEEVISLFGTLTPGPGGSANTIVYMIYQKTTQDPAVAAVLAITLLVIVVIIRQIINLGPKVSNHIFSPKKK